MTETPRDRPETDPENTGGAVDRKIAGDGKSRPEPRNFGGANQGADPTQPADGDAEIAADDAGASAMAERAANDVERP